MPFVLYSQPTGVFDGKGFSQAKAQEEAHRRYSEILRDVEVMIDDYSKCAASYTWVPFFAAPSTRTEVHIDCPCP